MTTKSLRLAFALFLPVVGAFGAAAEAPKEGATSAAGAAKDKPEDRKDDKKSDDKEPAPAVTEHTITVGGKVIHYKATAGYYYMKGDETSARGRGEAGEGAPGPNTAKPAADAVQAKIFYVAYTREEAGAAAARPITFAFNGGPGAAAVWLHMGALGPRTAHLSERGEAPPPPYRLEDNPYTWLDDTDLVFIDPMSTGFSRPAAGVPATKFYGYQQDLASVGDFIRLYTTRNERWGSPKFIAGESYGTTRAAGLAGYLQEKYGLYMNGIVLISSVLNFQSLSFAVGNDEAYPLYLPTYAAAAWYHKRLSPEMEAKPLTEVLREAEAFAQGDYTLALMRGDTLPAEEKARVAAEMARLIGLPAAHLAQLNLREPDGSFFVDLLQDRNRNLGRYDSRFTGINTPGALSPDFDPSSEAVTPVISATFNDYVRRELKFESDLPYETIAPVGPWPLSSFGYLDVADALRRAMSANPYLKVWVVCGYYDMATPYFSAKTTVAKMEIDPAIRANLTMTYYESGHMVYIDRPSHAKLKSDFETFLQAAILPSSAMVPTAAP